MAAPAGVSAPPGLLGNVVRTDRGWQASLPSPGGQLIIGVFSSRQLATVALDVLRLGSGLSTGLGARQVPLEYTAEDYLDNQTAEELRKYSLPEIVAAVRSYAIGGPRAPACGVVDEQRQLVDASAGSAAAPRALGARAGEDSWRGITRDNNGRTAYWVALLYASLDKEKRPVLPGRYSKVSLYVASCKSVREAAVAHDLAVLWWRAGTSHVAPQRGNTAGPGRAMQAQQVAQQYAQQGQGQGRGEQQRPQDGAQPPAAAEAEAQQAQQAQQGAPPTQAMEWATDKAVLRQLNFPLHMYTDLPLIQPLLACKTLNDCRSFVCKLRDAGDLAALAANSRALRASPQPSDRPLHAGSSGAGAGGARPAKRARKPGGGGGPGSPAPLRRGSAADGAPLAAPAGVDDTIEVGKHGRLHDKPYMGLVRDRQITLHPWRPMICAMVEGHSKPQPRSLASCSTAEEAAVARDLGWVWLWRRNSTLRQHAALNFSLQSYQEHGGELLDEVALQPTLQGLRAYLRGLRDSGRLLALSATLERSQGRLDHSRVQPAGVGPAGQPGRADEGHGGAGGGSDEEGGYGGLSPAEEMPHVLEGVTAGNGGPTATVGSKRERDEQRQHGGGEEAEPRGGDGSGRSGLSGSERSESESEEDAGAIEDSEDDDWQARKKKRRAPARRQRGVPPPGLPPVAPAPRALASALAQQQAQRAGLLPGRPLLPPSREWAAHSDSRTAGDGWAALARARASQQQQLVGSPLQHPLQSPLQRSPSAAAAAAAASSPGSGLGTPPGAQLHAESPGKEFPGGEGSGGRFVGVQRIGSLKPAASKQWIPRPTVRVAEGKRTLSKQLTLCYCDTAEEAAVARDLATLWNWQQLGVPEHSAQHRLNFQLARYRADGELMRRLATVESTEGVQALAKELRDSGRLRQLATTLGSPAPSPSGAAAAPPAAPDEPAKQGENGRGTKPPLPAAG